MKQHLSTADRNDIVSVSCFVDEIGRVCDSQSQNWNELIIANLGLARAYTTEAIRILTDQLPVYEIEAVTKIIDRHCVYVASRKHNPQDNELPISKDKLVDAGLVLLGSCDVCENRAEFADCGVFKFLNEYFDISRNGMVCPYDNLKPEEAEG